MAFKITVHKMQIVVEAMLLLQKPLKRVLEIEKKLSLRHIQPMQSTGDTALEGVRHSSLMVVICATQRKQHYILKTWYLKNIYLLIKFKITIYFRQTALPDKDRYGCAANGS